MVNGRITLVVQLQCSGSQTNGCERDFVLIWLLNQKKLSAKDGVLCVKNEINIKSKCHKSAIERPYTSQRNTMSNSSKNFLERL